MRGGSMWRSATRQSVGAGDLRVVAGAQLVIPKSWVRTPIDLMSFPDGVFKCMLLILHGDIFSFLT